jgi:SAM-dependent methyltransferase
MLDLEPDTAEGPPDRHDPWRLSILAERGREPAHTIMKKALLLLERPKNDALILGDASLIQSRHLIEEAGFKSVVDVDISPSLLDDFYEHERLKKELSAFERYEPPQASFDFIYGKSISFYPKENIPEYLKQLKASLRDNGVFAAEWARQEDTFSRQRYALEEIDAMYEASGFEIVEMITGPPRDVKGLVVPGVGHTVRVIAKPKMR